MFVSKRTVAATRALGEKNEGVGGHWCKVESGAGKNSMKEVKPILNILSPTATMLGQDLFGTIIVR
jgi:hypothetical protein